MDADVARGVEHLKGLLQEVLDWGPSLRVHTPIQDMTEGEWMPLEKQRRDQWDDLKERIREVL